jgi:hypothetical protein
MAILKSATHLLLGEPSASLAAIEQASGGGSDVPLQEWHQAAAAALGDAAAVTRARARTAGTAAPGPVGRAVGHHGAAVDASIAGRWDEARAEYEQAIEGYRGVGYLVDAHLTGLAFDAYLGARFPEARRAGEDAAAWFAERGGEHIVERYRAAFRGTPAPAVGTPTGPGKSPSPTSEVEAR